MPLLFHRPGLNVWEGKSLNSPSDKYTESHLPNSFTQEAPDHYFYHFSSLMNYIFGRGSLHAQYLEAEMAIERERG